MVVQVAMEPGALADGGSGEDGPSEASDSAVDSAFGIWRGNKAAGQLGFEQMANQGGSTTAGARGASKALGKLGQAGYIAQSAVRGKRMYDAYQRGDTGELVAEGSKQLKDTAITALSAHNPALGVGAEMLYQAGDYAASQAVDAAIPSNEEIFWDTANRIKPQVKEQWQDKFFMSDEAFEQEFERRIASGHDRQYEELSQEYRRRARSLQSRPTTSQQDTSANPTQLMNAIAQGIQAGTQPTPIMSQSGKQSCDTDGDGNCDGIDSTPGGSQSPGGATDAGRGDGAPSGGSSCPVSICGLDDEPGLGDLGIGDDDG